jgi:hypothetical protein
MVPRSLMASSVLQSCVLFVFGIAVLYASSSSSIAFLSAKARASTPSSLPAANDLRSFRVEYEPSALETLWASNLGAWNDNICEVLGSPSQARDISLVLELMDSQDRLDNARSAEHSLLLQRAVSSGILSRLKRTFSDGSVQLTYLEPLVGMMRDPRVSCPEGKRGFWGPSVVSAEEALQKKMWLLVSGSGLYRQAQNYPRRTSRALLFDIGASKWASTAANGARWLSRQYESVGITFEHIYAWEARPVQASEFFEGASVADTSRLHFMNWPVSSSSGDKLNPWTLLRQAAVRDDFVVVKLDIDTPLVEMALVQQLIDDPELHSLVDVFYFEHHVSIPDFSWIWRMGEYPQTLNDSYEIFGRLRRFGIRASTWP